MIPKDALGRLTFVGKSLREITSQFTEAGYIVNVELLEGKLILSVSQLIEIDLGTVQASDVKDFINAK